MFEREVVLALLENDGLSGQQRKALTMLEVMLDGDDAATRTGKYAGATDIPPCPHAEGTREYDWWHDGFNNGTDRLLYGDVDE